MTETLPYSLDLLSSPVPGQIGFCVLDLDGRIVDGGQQQSNNIGCNSVHCTIVQDAPILFQMLQESTSIIPPASFNTDDHANTATTVSGLRRMTIDFDDDSKTRYIIGRDSTHVYLIQTST